MAVHKRVLSLTNNTTVLILHDLQGFIDRLMVIFRAIEQISRRKYVKK